MEIMRKIFVLMMIHVSASSEFEQSPQLYCRGIEMSIASEGCPENPKIAQGIISIEQLKNEFNFENQNNDFSNFLNDLLQQDIFQIFHYFEEYKKIYKFSINLISQLTQESDLLNELETKFNLKSGLSYAMIHPIIPCSIIVIQQFFQIQSRMKFQNQFETFSEQQKKKVLLSPFFFQIIIDETIYALLAFKIGAADQDFYIYLLPFALYLESICLNFCRLLKWTIKVLESKCLACLFIFAYVVLNTFIFNLFLFPIEKSTYYQYCPLYIYHPQILFNFKFHFLQLNWKIVLKQLSTKIFYIVYIIRFSNLSSRDTDFNLWVSLIDYTAFLLTFYLQNRYGLKKLMKKFKFWKKNINGLLQEQDKEVCSICYAEMNDINSSQYASGIVITGCKHKFHSSCLQTWFKEQKICPLCRQGINASIFERNIQLNCKK